MLRVLGACPPTPQSAVPTRHQLGAPAQSKQPFAFYLVGLEGGKSRRQLPNTCFQAPPQKGALTVTELGPALCHTPPLL